MTDERAHEAPYVPYLREPPRSHDAASVYLTAEQQVHAIC